MTVVSERTSLDLALERGTARLLELQHPGGWWVGELESNATMIAQHLFWHHFTGLRTPELDRKIANELEARQRGDGTWSIWHGGPPDLSTTVEAYAALRLAGRDPGDAAREYARCDGRVRRAPCGGGRSRSRSGGCASARRRTGRGPGSSRRGSGRSSCLLRSATGSKTRRSGVPSRGGAGS